MAAIAFVGAFTGLGLLLVSGVGHLWHLGAFTEAVRLHRAVPDRLAPPFAATVTLGELALGGVGVVGLTAGMFPVQQSWSHRLALPVLAGAAAVYACFAAYGAFLVRRRPGVPCGCSLTADAISWVVVGRAVVLAAACAGATTVLPEMPVAKLTSTAGVLLATSVAVFVVLAWSLPAALRTAE